MSSWDYNCPRKPLSTPKRRATIVRRIALLLLFYLNGFAALTNSETVPQPELCWPTQGCVRTNSIAFDGKISWINGRNGTMLVTHGKTAAARRLLPMTPRVRAVLQMRWENAGKPSQGRIWPAPTCVGHIDRSSLKKQHKKAVRISGVRPFVLYSLRHTFLTRLGASGCDAWTLARIAGHSSVAISSRYVHPSEDNVLAAVERLGGHKTGHSAGDDMVPGENGPGQKCVQTIPQPLYSKHHCGEIFGPRNEACTPVAIGKRTRSNDHTWVPAT